VESNGMENEHSLKRGRSDADSTDTSIPNDDQLAAKRVKISPAAPSANMSLVVASDEKSKAVVVSEAKPGMPKRTSSLMAPTMELSGHGGAIFTAKFNPSGSHLASAGFDKSVLIWQVYGECKNTAVLTGHKGPILEIAWSRDGDQIFSASADKTGGVFDVESAQRIKTLRDHTSFVNAVSPSRRGDPLLLTGSDDGCAMLWDARLRGARQVLETSYQITAVALSEDNTRAFTGGIDDEIKVWDLRMGKIEYGLAGANDTITGLRLSPDGSFLLSNSMDNCVRQWDVRPYATTRLMKVFVGARHDVQKNLLKCAWSPDGHQVTAGSADRFVYIWDVASTRILYKLPGHTGPVNEVDFHPNEPIILSCSNDKRIFVGEIQPYGVS